jgi:hypothetical protein
MLMLPMIELEFLAAFFARSRNPPDSGAATTAMIRTAVMTAAAPIIET